MRERLRPLTRLGLKFRESDHYGLITGFSVNPNDLRANLDAIAAAASAADVVVASIHAHRQGPWLTEIAHQAIERGASIVFIHGPHRVQALELFKDRPVFYSMGDFVFEANQIARLPAEAYEERGLPPDAPLEELSKSHFQGRFVKLNRREVYEGFAAAIDFAGRRIARIRLIPVDLQLNGATEDRGRPRLAAPALGREIVERVGKASKPYGTRIAWREESGCGEVALGR
jgi:poly-gamma-glutamate synthesis protein (capsule biosynthesis protein)